MKTLYDIAKATGFSTSTVSRALNNSGYCNPKTKAIIEKAAKEMNYRPSNAGRVLKSQKSDRVMFCIPDIMNPFYFNMIRAISERLSLNDYYFLLSYTMHDESEEFKYLNLLQEHYADGMIMVSFDFNEELVEEMRKSNFPIVATNMIPNLKEDDNFDIVYVDHIKAMYIATEHLILNGHKDICVVVGNLSEQTSQERLSGFERAMNKYNIEFSDDNIFIGDYTIDSGKLIAEEISQSKKKFTGIVCSNDLMSMGIVSKLQYKGFDIPNDFSIISLDNTEYADAIHPSLTSVDMKQYELGNLSCKLLLEKIIDERKGSKVIRLEPELVIRESVRELN